MAYKNHSLKQTVSSVRCIKKIVSCYDFILEISKLEREVQELKLALRQKNQVRRASLFGQLIFPMLCCRRWMGRLLFLLGFVSDRLVIANISNVLVH